MNGANNNTDLKFYTTNEIAEMLKMNVQVIARKLKYGELVGYKIGKDWRVRESELNSWLDKHSNRTLLNPGQMVVNRFMKDGRFAKLPVQQARRRYILEHILRAFEQNRVYDEKEVNGVITRFHDDYCLVRREFIMAKMMSRKDGKYRRNASYIFAK
jgi:excisionase family DNA binding protein